MFSSSTNNDGAEGDNPPANADLRDPNSSLSRMQRETLENFISCTILLACCSTRQMFNRGLRVH